MSSNSFSLETNLEIQNPSVVCTIFSDKSKSLDLCKKQWIVSPLFLYLYFKIYILIFKNMSYHSGSVGKESACNAGDAGLTPGLGRSLGGGHGNPLQYSCLENTRDRGAWWAIVLRVTKSRTRVKWLSTHIQQYLWVVRSRFFII